MKLILSLLGVVLLVVAAVYFMMPADQLPSFFPGYEAGVTHVHTKHGIVAGVAGLVLLGRGCGWDAGEGSGDSTSQLSAFSHSNFKQLSSSYPAHAGYPVRRGFSILSRMSRNTGSPAFAGDDT